MPWPETALFYKARCSGPGPLRVRPWPDSFCQHVLCSLLDQAFGGEPPSWPVRELASKCKHGSSFCQVNLRKGAEQPRQWAHL